MFMLSRLIQRLAPNLHRWNSSTLFSIERLKVDIGWVPEYTFPAMVEQTYAWFRRAGLDVSLEFDWTFEDALLAHLERSQLQAQSWGQASGLARSSSGSPTCRCAWCGFGKPPATGTNVVPSPA